MIGFLIEIDSLKLKRVDRFKIFQKKDYFLVIKNFLS